MKLEIQMEFLKDEYLLLQEFYEDVDRRCLAMKNWGMTIGLATIGAGFAYAKQIENSYIFFLGAFIASVVFWYLESFWRGTHFFIANRIKKIEKAFRKDEYKSLPPFQLYTDWAKDFNKYGSQTWRYMFKSVTRLPHIVFALVSLTLFILSITGQLSYIP